MSWIKTPTIVLAAISLTIICILLPVALLELVLRKTTILDQLDSPSPTYIPQYLRVENKKIFEEGGFMTEDGFRVWYPGVKNLTEQLKSDTGCKIVVLGDSFVMGGGVAANATWVAKLADRTNCNVYPFGRNGWTSYEQFGFYENVLSREEIDYLIVGVVSNDPHPRGNYGEYRFGKKTYIRKHFRLNHYLGLSSEIHNRLKENYVFYDYALQITKNTLTPLFKGSGSMSNSPVISYGYKNWEDRLYELDVYNFWIGAVNEFAKKAETKPCFILTPTTVTSRQKRIWDQIDASFRELGLTYFNTFSALEEIFTQGFRPRIDWANLADGHPGQRQTELYSETALSCLNAKDIIVED